MSVSLRHLFQQGPVLRGLVKVAASSLGHRWRKAQKPDLPGAWLTQTVPPRNARLVVDYIRWTGGDFARYGECLPPHLFPQWGVPLLTQSLQDIPYALTGVLNQGCKMTLQAPLPKDQPLQLRARLEDIDDNGERARLHSRLITGTLQQPDALIVDIYAVVRLTSGEKKPREKPQLPSSARSIAHWGIGPKAGWEFALLTGDFNPIHWLPLAARTAGFRGTILHGFASMALVIERLHTHLDATRRPPLHTIDVRFTRPLVLPNDVSLHLDDTSAETQTTPLYLTDQQNEICMVGHFSCATS